MTNQLGVDMSDTDFSYCITRLYNQSVFLSRSITSFSIDWAQLVTHLVQFERNSLHSLCLQEFNQLPLLLSDVPHASFCRFEEVNSFHFIEDASLPYVRNFEVCLVVNLQERHNALYAHVIAGNKRPSYISLRDTKSNNLIGLLPLDCGPSEKSWRPYPSFQLLTNTVLKPFQCITIEALNEELFCLNGLTATVTLSNYSKSRRATFVNVSASPFPCSFTSMLSLPPKNRPVIQHAKYAATVEISASNVSSCWLVLEPLSSDSEILVAPLRLTTAPRFDGSASWTLYLLKTIHDFSSEIVEWPYFHTKSLSTVSSSSFVLSLSPSQVSSVDLSKYTPKIIGLIHDDVLVMPCAKDTFEEVSLPLVLPPSPPCKSLPSIPPPPDFSITAVPKPKTAIVTSLPDRTSDSESDQEFDAILQSASKRFMYSPCSTVSPLCDAAVLNDFRPSVSQFRRKSVDEDSGPPVRSRSESNTSNTGFGIGVDVLGAFLKVKNRIV
ncbi:hypothetical protein GEMRC1_002128 [Eukaryota sp. GEM-RC1]